MELVVRQVQGKRVTLENQFQRACELAVDECRALGYVPTAWISMMRGPGVVLGGVSAARRLLTSGDVQSGFERPIRMDRPDLTVEQAVLDEGWAELFSDAHREAAARWRLAQAEGGASRMD
jgi:hypothetical protein